MHLWEMSMSPQSHGLTGPFFEPLLAELNDLRPHATAPSHKEMPVILQPGKAVGLHQHKQHTLIYFIDAEDVPLFVRDEAIWPANNTAILLEPNTPHAVARNTTERPRLSLALRFAPCES